MCPVRTRKLKCPLLKANVFVRESLDSPPLISSSVSELLSLLPTLKVLTHKDGTFLTGRPHATNYKRDLCRSSQSGRAPFPGWFTTETPPSSLLCHSSNTSAMPSALPAKEPFPDMLRVRSASPRVAVQNSDSGHADTYVKLSKSLVLGVMFPCY